MPPQLLCSYLHFHLKNTSWTYWCIYFGHVQPQIVLCEPWSPTPDCVIVRVRGIPLPLVSQLLARKCSPCTPLMWIGAGNIFLFCLPHKFSQILRSHNTPHTIKPSPQYKTSHPNFFSTTSNFYYFICCFVGSEESVSKSLLSWSRFPTHLSMCS